MHAHLDSGACSPAVRIRASFGNHLFGLSADLRSKHPALLTEGDLLERAPDVPACKRAMTPGVTEECHACMGHMH